MKIIDEEDYKWIEYDPFKSDVYSLGFFINKKK